MISLTLMGCLKTSDSVITPNMCSKFYNFRIPSLLRYLYKLVMHVVGVNDQMLNAVMQKVVRKESLLMQRSQNCVQAHDPAQILRVSAWRPAHHRWHILHDCQVILLHPISQQGHMKFNLLQSRHLLDISHDAEAPHGLHGPISHHFHSFLGTVIFKYWHKACVHIRVQVCIMVGQALPIYTTSFDNNSENIL